MMPHAKKSILFHFLPLIASLFLPSHHWVLESKKKFITTFHHFGKKETFLSSSYIASASSREEEKKSKIGINEWNKLIPPYVPLYICPDILWVGQDFILFYFLLPPLTSYSFFASRKEEKRQEKLRVDAKGKDLKVLQTFVQYINKFVYIHVGGYAK